MAKATSVKNSKPLTGKKFAIVGRMPSPPVTINGSYVYSHYELAQKIRTAGGTTTGSTSYYSPASPLTKSCDYLILGNSVKQSTLEKLASPAYEKVIPIFLEILVKVINEGLELPSSRESYEKQLEELREQKKKMEEEMRRKEQAKKYIEFAKRCGIKYDINEPANSKYIAKKMDISVSHVLEETAKTDPQPIRIPIKIRRM